MSKKHRPTKPQVKQEPRPFDLESTPYFTPIAFVVLLLALVILFREFIFSDRMLYLSDQLQAGIFFRTFLVNYVQDHGAVPQWNPYIFGGMPYVDAFHGDIFYPLSVLKFILSTDRWQSWTLFFHIFLAGLFMYFAARQFRLSKLAGLLSAACYMFAANLVSLVAPGHDGKIYVITLFPLVMLFLDRGLSSGRLREALFNFSLLGLVIGVAVLSPHPQMSYFMLWAAALYALFKLIVMWRESGSVLRLMRPAVLTIYAVVIGLLISAIQFYPGYSYTTNFSPRSDEKRGWEWATSWSLHEEEAFSVIIPEFSGTNSQGRETFYWGKNAFKDNSESVGAPALFLALIGVFFYRRRESHFFAGLGLFALLYALGDTTPIFKIFFHLMPMVKSLRAPSMIMFMFSFSAALLAGMGLQAIISLRGTGKGAFPRRLWYLLWGFPGVLLLLALLFGLGGRSMLSVWTSLFYSEAATTFVRTGVSKLDVAYMNLPAIQSGAWMAFLFSAVAALLASLYLKARAGIWAAAALVLVPVIDGVRFNKRFISTVDPADFLAPNVVSNFFAERSGTYRVMNFTAPMVREDYLPFMGVEVVVGYHGNQLRWYDNLLGGVRKSNQANPRLLNLCGARYLLLRADQQLPEDYLGTRPAAVAADFGPIKVWQNDNALPRVFLVDSVRVFDDLEDMRQQVLKGSDDLRRVVYLEEAPSRQYTCDSNAVDSVWFMEYQPDSVVLGVNAASNKILVLIDNYYDAWHAFIDGAPAPVYRSYSSFRAVEIPPGSHQVLFRYESDRYRTGKLVTTLTSLYLIIIIGFYAFFALRKNGQ